MLIRNARIDGYPGPVDLRLMHGRVQEIGVGLQKGLYESALNLAGDVLLPLTEGMPLPPRLRRVTVQKPGAHIVPGTPEPLTRWRDGRLLGLIDQHTAD